MISEHVANQGGTWQHNMGKSKKLVAENLEKKLFTQNV